MNGNEATSKDQPTTPDQIKERIAGLVRMTQVLYDDTTLFGELPHLSQPQRRAYVRSVFAYIEGVTFRLKSEPLKWGGNFGIEYNDAERALMEDEEFFMKDDGTVSKKHAKIRTLVNFKFAFQVLSRFTGVYEIDHKSEAWKSLESALSVRDRLTHPKSEAALEVSEDDLFDVGTALVYCMNLTNNAMRALTEYITNKIHEWETMMVRLQELDEGKRLAAEVEELIKSGNMLEAKKLFDRVKQTQRGQKQVQQTGT